MHPLVSLGWTIGAFIYTFSFLLQPPKTSENIDYKLTDSVGHITISFNRQKDVYHQYSLIAEYIEQPSSAEFDIFYGNQNLHNVVHRTISGITSKSVTLLKNQPATTTILIDGDFSKISNIKLVWDGYYTITNFKYYFMLFAFSILFLTLIWKDTMVFTALFGLGTVFVVYFDYQPKLNFLLRLSLIIGINYNNIGLQHIPSSIACLFQIIAIMINQPLISATVMVVAFICHQIFSKSRQAVTYVGYVYLLLPELFEMAQFSRNSGYFYVTLVGLLWEYLSIFQTLSLQPYNAPAAIAESEEDKPYFTALELSLILTPFIALSATKYYQMIPVPGYAFITPDKSRIFSMKHNSEWAIFDEVIAKPETTADYSNCSLCSQFKPTNTQKSNSLRDLLITIAYNSNLDGIYSMVRSLRSTGSNAKVVIMHNEKTNKMVNNELKNSLKNCGVHFINLGNPSVLSYYQKFGMLYDFLKIYKHSFDRVIYLNENSVLFQDNPFEAIDFTKLNLPQSKSLIKNIQYINGGFHCINKKVPGGIENQQAVFLSFIASSLNNVKNFAKTIIKTGKQEQSKENCNVESYINLWLYQKSLNNQFNFSLTNMETPAIYLNKNDKFTGETFGEMNINKAKPAMIINAKESTQIIQAFEKVCPQ